jgi:hypothetical protein
MKMNIFSRFKKKSKSGKKDILSILEESRRENKKHLKISMSEVTARELHAFLKEKGLNKTDGTEKLIEYGLSDESEEELEILRMEKESQMSQLGRQYSVMRFKTYEYYLENKNLTMKLRSMLKENRSLKVRLGKVTDRFSTVDEWDSWSEEKIDELLKRYVFTK